MFQTCYIFSQCNGLPLSVSRQVLIVNRHAMPDIFFAWDVIPMVGTPYYALRHQATQMFAYVGNGDGNAVVVKNFTPLDHNFMLRFDALHVPGAVAINRWDGGAVFDVAGSGGDECHSIWVEWQQQPQPSLADGAHCRLCTG